MIRMNTAQTHLPASFSKEEVLVVVVVVGGNHYKAAGMMPPKRRAYQVKKHPWAAGSSLGCPGVGMAYRRRLCWNWVSRMNRSWEVDKGFEEPFSSVATGLHWTRLQRGAHAGPTPQAEGPPAQPGCSGDDGWLSSWAGPFPVGPWSETPQLSKMLLPPAARTLGPGPAYNSITLNAHTSEPSYPLPKVGHCVGPG